MSSIRPLITITILVVVGAYLYVKINEGAVSPKSHADEVSGQTADGVPPLATASVAPTTNEGPAPTWPASTNTGPTAPPLSTSANVNASSTAVAPIDTAPPETAVTANAIPAVPAVPAIPEVPATAQAQPVTAPPLPTELPANIPEARYPDQIEASEGATPIGTSVSAPQSISTENAATVAPAPAPGAPQQELVTTPEQMNAASSGASGLASSPLRDQPNPLRQPQPSTTAIDRYAASAATASSINAAGAAPPIEPTFAASWPAIQAALDRGELAEAHKQLSKWEGDPSLTPTDAERVDSLLNQLAGTVVYSTEHQLAPAHTVKPGETLETIAKQYNVPWQLLAKINGIPAANQVRPGQELKVVPGPFSATIDLERKQLTLTVDGRYAGKFPVNISPGQTVADGQWVVEEKTVAASNGNAPTSVAEFMSGDRAIVLRGEATSAGAAPAAASTVTIAPNPPATATPNSGGAIQVSAKDAEELSDILSVGSRVIIRR